MSTSEKTEGLVIRQADFSETSRVVTFYTRDFGKISALAKGAKRLKSSFEAAIDLLTRCQIVFLRKSSGGLDLLTEARLVHRFRLQSRDVNVHYAGLYVAELLNTCSEEYDPDPLWYDAAVITLNRLQLEDDFRLPLLRFELFTLQVLGVLPEFEMCGCGHPVENNQESWSVWIQQGQLLCSQCRQTELSTRPLTGEVLVWLRELIDISISEQHPSPLPPKHKNLIRHLVTALISHTLDRRPKMLSYLRF